MAKPPFPTKSDSAKPSEPARGGSRHGKADSPGTGLGSLPGRMAGSSDGSSFSTGSGGGPSPAERLKKASSGCGPCTAKPGGAGRGSKKT